MTRSSSKLSYILVSGATRTSCCPVEMFILTCTPGGRTAPWGTSCHSVVGLKFSVVLADRSVVAVCADVSELKEGVFPPPPLGVPDGALPLPDGPLSSVGPLLPSSLTIMSSPPVFIGPLSPGMGGLPPPPCSSSDVSPSPPSWTPRDWGFCSRLLCFIYSSGEYGNGAPIAFSSSAVKGSPPSSTRFFFSFSRCSALLVFIESILSFVAGQGNLA